MNDKEYLKWIMPSIRNRSVSIDDVNGKFNFRIEKAKEQNSLPIVSRKEIIKYVNEFLTLIDLEIVVDPVVKPINRQKRRIDYTKINTTNKQDIVWIKFSNNNRISVIGTGCDISFTNYARHNTTAGIINNSLGLEWDDTEVLIFPLYNLKVELNRSDIESGIGNYLISKKVPILDFYSHNY